VKTVRLTSTEAIVYGTLAVGTLDILDAILFYRLRSNVSPTRIFQSIASGLLGKASFSGGIATAALGLGLHYLIAFSVVAAYLVASRWWTRLRHDPLVYGPIYGVLVYLFMNEIVVPLSQAATGVKPLSVVLNGLAIHILGVGIPAALLARAAD
jgi:uncharacterized membrane protein YagU involved in acid resistance